jgi:hypothetical protein
MNRATGGECWANGGGSGEVGERRLRQQTAWKGDLSSSWRQGRQSPIESARTGGTGVKAGVKRGDHWWSWRQGRTMRCVPHHSCHEGPWRVVASWRIVASSAYRLVELGGKSLIVGVRLVHCEGVCWGSLLGNVPCGRWGRKRRRGRGKSKETNRRAKPITLVGRRTERSRHCERSSR